MRAYLKHSFVILLLSVVNALPQEPYTIIVTEFLGYEPSLILEALNFSNLTYGEDILFECIAQEDYFGILQSVGANDSIIGGYGATAMELMFLAAGLSFSVSTFESGLSVGYVRDNSSSIAQIYYLKAFSWDMYLMLLLLPVVLGYFLYIFQKKNQACLNYMHQFYTYYFKTDFLKGLNLESRLLEAVFQLTMTVVMTLYVSFLTIELRQQQTYEGISSLNDIRGSRIASAYIFENFVETLGGRYVELPGVNSADSDEELAISVLSSNCSYFVFDTPFIDDMARTNCDISVILRDFTKFDYAVLWTQYAPHDIISKIDLGIINRLEEKPQNIRSQEAINLLSSASFCSDSSGQANIRFSDVSSLWILWILFAAAAFIILTISKIMRRYHNIDRTTFDLEIRGKREDILKNSLSSTLSGRALISVTILRKQRMFLLQNAHYCYEKMNIKPYVRGKIRDIMKNDLELVEGIADIPAIEQNNHKLDRDIKRKKKSMIQRLFFGIGSENSHTNRSIFPKSLNKKSSQVFSLDFDSQAALQDELPPLSIKSSTEIASLSFKDSFKGAARKIGKNFRIQFSKAKIDELADNYALQELNLARLKEEVVKDYSSKLKLELGPMQQQFIEPKILSSTIPEPQKPKKVKILRQLLNLPNILRSKTQIINEPCPGLRFESPRVMIEQSIESNPSLPGEQTNKKIELQTVNERQGVPGSITKVLENNKVQDHQIGLSEVKFGRPKNLRTIEVKTKMSKEYPIFNQSP